jgi:hypothetical protein
MPANDPSHQAPAETTARFTPEELAYLLAERHLGRLATTDATAAPHVVPVGWSYNPELGTIDISGHNFARNPQVPQRPGQPTCGIRRRRRTAALPTPLRHGPRQRPGAGRQLLRRHRSNDPHHPQQDHLLGPGRHAAGGWPASAITGDPA